MSRPTVELDAVINTAPSPRPPSRRVGPDGSARRDGPIQMSTVAQEAVWNPGQPSRQAMAPRESNTDGIRLRLHLECPDEATEETFLRTLDLVQDEDFQHARRRLWAWESTLSPKGSPENYSGSSEISGLWYVDHGEEQDRMAARLAEIRPFLDERAWRLLLGPRHAL